MAAMQLNSNHTTRVRSIIGCTARRIKNTLKKHAPLFFQQAEESR